MSAIEIHDMVTEGSHYIDQRRSADDLESKTPRKCSKNHQMRDTHSLFANVLADDMVTEGRDPLYRPSKDIQLMT